MICSKCGRTQGVGKYCQECGGELCERKPLTGTLDVLMEPQTNGISYQRDWMNNHQQRNVDHWLNRLKICLSIAVSEYGEVSACALRLYHEPESGEHSWGLEKPE